VEDPALTPGAEDDADVDLGVRTPDADADIRFLEDRAASLCVAPQTLDVRGHHLVVLDDLDRIGRREFYRGIAELGENGR
jgi:hypothetical protein